MMTIRNNNENFTWSDRSGGNDHSVSGFPVMLDDTDTHARNDDAYDDNTA